MRGIKGIVAVALMMLMNLCCNQYVYANDWCTNLTAWFSDCILNQQEVASGGGYVVNPCHINSELNQPTYVTPRIFYYFNFTDYIKVFNENWTSQNYTAECYYPDSGNPDNLPLNNALNNGELMCCNVAGDPINIGTGNVFRKEDDFTVGRWLKFSRYYNSSSSVTNDVIGQHWRHTYSRSLLYTAGTAPSVTINEEDGRTTTWILTGTSPSNTWGTTIVVGDDLTETMDSNGNPTGWTLVRTKKKITEQYNAAGQLVAIQEKGGFVTTLKYSTAQTISPTAPAAGLLVSVTDAAGNSLSFSYNEQSQLASVTLPSGEAYSYGYDASGNLTSVTFPDGASRQYLYNEAPYLNGSTGSSLLTGIVDESGNRYETYTYDSSNRATSNLQAGGVNSVSIAYASNNAASITDALGNLTTRTYGITGGLAQVTGNSGPCIGCANVASYARDFNGNVTSSTDFNGNVSQYTYDFDNVQTSRAETVGTSQQRTFYQTWNQTLHIPTQWSVVDNSGNPLAMVDWVYNASGEITAQCAYDPNVAGSYNYACGSATSAVAGVRQWSYSYCTATGTNCPIVGLLLSSTGPRTDLSQVTTYTYSANGNVQSVTDPMGHTTNMTSYDSDGHVKSLQDPNGVITTFNYTPRGWLASVAVGGATTTYTYMPYGAVHTMSDPDGVQTTYGYDAAHRLTSIADDEGNYIQYTLDAAGDKVGEEIFDSNGNLHKSLARSFNSLGQLIKVVDGLGNTIFSVNGAGGYDADGNLLQSEDGFGIVRQKSYDALNRLIQTIDNYNGSDSATQNTKAIYSYDNLSNLSQVTDPSGLNTAYIHDAFGDITSQTSPDSGATTRTYDMAGNVLTSTDARGITATNTYDALNRILTTTYADTTKNVTYSYDESNAVTGCASSDSIGRLTRIIETSVTTIFCYDARGKIIERQQVMPGGNIDVTFYSLTPAGRLASITYPSGTVVSYARDGDGRITSVAVSIPGGGGATVASNVTYLPFGPVTGYTLGNGQIISRSYDADYRLTDLTSSSIALHYARDVMGDIVALGSSPGANPALETYAYDPLYRLTGIFESAGNTLESVTYNQSGDRLVKTGSALGTGQYSYNSGTHQLNAIGNSVRTVDADGNTTAVSEAAGTYGFGYDARDRLTVVQLAGGTVGTYIYNAFGQRISKLVNGNASRFDYNQAGQLLSEYGATNRDYVWMDGVPVANIDNPGSAATLAYVISDQLNTPRVVTNSVGSVVWQWPYQGNPWGELTPTSSNYTYNLQFPGQYSDQESILSNNYFRDYDSSSGRYIQSDPLGLAGGNNTYAYVANNPLSATDPRGQDDTFCMFNPTNCGWLPPPPTDPNASRNYNPNLQSNMGTGTELGILGGIGVGALAVANVIGFPEVEIGEAGALAIGGDGVATLELLDAAAGEPVASLAVGGISGGGAGALVGGGGGYLATNPMSLTTSQATTSPVFGPFPNGPTMQSDIGWCP
ncbi:RHS repeat-associated core domain-containing protein [Dyella mobilis]|uniref:RHS repeat protein n=1 Tax=Dyella mobilis TaxID=1849582 RepID=A0ABS2KG72_9GAMM|nr:RHS repeat-associated core domain-containing protein [Dyella mobilis]MBM7129368.1 RHS repeat protein [Dyella mobilis]GLQ98663.1 type IV secretion protein Rhs [Dyella mobilis]